MSRAKTTRLLLGIGLILLYCVNTEAKSNLISTYGDFTYNFSGLFKPEMFYGKNINLLNNNNINDKSWYARHTFDLNTDISYGNLTYGYPVAEFLFSVRNKAIWGNAETIAQTASSDIKIRDVVNFAHSHGFPRHIFWMREVWLRMNLAEILNLTIGDSHQLTVGSFPFELGRGIALGDAYAVGPELLGYNSPTGVDQYAYGALVEGDLIKNTIYYGLYAAILRNKAASFKDTSEKILGQQYGRIDIPERGFGKINFVVASHLIWTVFNNALGMCTLEPYALFNSDPEQQVQFLADAKSKLGTIGLAAEYIGHTWEFGFDYAFNLGHQHVKGWDRNRIDLQNRNGLLAVVNSAVVDQNGKNIPFIAGSDAEKIIDATKRGQQDESLNGKVIGTLENGVGFVTTPVALTNSKTRFRNPYENKYEGWMIVADVAWWLYKKDVRIAATAGITTGDENPNIDTQDRVYRAFIPLQEQYSGKRVKSAFLLGGSGRISRPLSAPTDEQAPSEFASTVDGFSNLVFCGVGLQWMPSDWLRKLAVKPNVLAYWQEVPTSAFDIATKKDSNRKASTFLGTEFNVFIDYYLLADLKLFCISSIFVPGKYYSDIRGKPLNGDQLSALKDLDVTGFIDDQIPNISNNVAYTLNIGLSFTF